MSLSIRVSGQAEFTHIKREMRDLNRSFETLRRTSEKGAVQGFLKREQAQSMQFFNNQLKDNIATLDMLLDEQYQKIERLNSALEEARSPETIRHLEKELNMRRQLVDATQEQIKAIEDRARRMEQQSGNIPTQGGVGGSVGGAGSALSMMGGFGGKLLGLAGLTMGFSFFRDALGSAVAGHQAVGQVGMRQGARPNLEALRVGGRNTGLPYGYNLIESMQAIDAFSSRGGSMTRGDQAAVQSFSRAWGMEGTQAGATLGEFRRFGASSVGQTRELADMLSNAIDRSKMQERAVEAMESTAGLMGDLGRVLPEVSVGGVMALQTLLNQSGNEGLRGERGADLISRLNSMFQGGSGSSEFFTLRALGWGTDKGWYEAEKQRELGISDPNNLAAVLQSVQRFGDPQMQDMALRQMTGLSFHQIEALRAGTNNFADLSVSNISRIQRDLEIGGSTVERSGIWQGSTAGQATIAEARLEEAIRTIGNGMVQNFIQLQNISADIVNMFAGLLGSDNTGKRGLFGLSPTTLVGGGLMAASTFGLGKGLMNLTRALFGGKSGGAAGGALGSALGGGALFSAGKAAGSFLGGHASNLMAGTRGWGTALTAKSPTLGKFVGGALGSVDNMLPSLAKTGTATSSKLLSKIPIAGAVVSTALNLAQGDSFGRALTRGIGTNVGSTLGLGAAAGLGVGTGGAGFAATGALAVGGGMAGDKASAKIYDTIAGWFTRRKDKPAPEPERVPQTFNPGRMTPASTAGRLDLNVKVDLAGEGLDGIAIETLKETVEKTFHEMEQRRVFSNPFAVNQH